MVSPPHQSPVTGLHATAQALLQRPIVMAAISFALGVASGSADWASPGFLAASGAAAIWALGMTRAGSRRVPVQIALLLAFAAAGAMRQYVQSKPGPHDISGWIGAGYVTVQGTIASDPAGEPQASFVLDADQVRAASGDVEAVTGRVWCSIAMSPDRRAPLYGDRILLRGELVTPAGPRNLGSPDRSAFLRRHGVFATMRMRHGSLWRPLPHGSGVSPVRWALGWRDSMLATFSRVLPAPTAAVLTGIVLGGSEGLSPDTEDAFVRSGLAHIMAASGANVAIFAWAVLWIAHRLYLGVRLSACLCCAVTLGYAVAAGAGPSVSRAALMAIAYLAAPILDRERDAPCALAFAALATLAWNPGYLLDVGFMLSFIIVALTLATMPIWTTALDHLLPMPAAAHGAALERVPALTRHITLGARRAGRAIVSVACLSATAGAASAPLTAQVFNAVPTMGIVANALAMPAVAVLLPASLAVWLVCLAIPPVGEAACRALVGPLAAYVTLVAEWASALPGSVLHVPSPGWWAVGASYAAMASVAIGFAGRPQR
jgi:competence protein ComEC